MKEIWYQFIYQRGHEVVCGVRLFKSEEDFRSCHPDTVNILKMIPHEIIRSTLWP